MNEQIRSDQDISCTPCQEITDGYGLIHLTHIIDIDEPGRLFIFDEYYGEIEGYFRFFITHSIPAYVMEYSINEHMNVHFVREYRVSSSTEQRFVGQDVVSANEKYIAHLLYDLEELIEIVRIYYRGESNFAYGHTDIQLIDFKVAGSSIHFLAYSDIF